MKSFSSVPCRLNNAIIMVSSYCEGQMSGWLAHPKLDAPKPFRSLPQMLFLLDDVLLREEGLISSDSFEPVGLEHIQRIATIHIQILFREHHTWQGCLRWEEQQKEASFRSVMEMIQLLDEILGE